MRSKTVRTISPTTHSRNVISVLTTEKNLLVGDILKNRAKRKSAEYVISQIVSQLTI